MRHLARLALAALLAAPLASGCGRPGQGSTWDVVEEMDRAERAFAPVRPPGPLGSPVSGVKDEDMPCLKTCHDREKWATGKPYPHRGESHRENGRHCIDCHAMGHRSAKADRRVCKDCH